MSYRIAIEYRAIDGTRQRVVYRPDRSGLAWLRREDVYDPDADRWRTRGREQITALNMTIRPVGGRSFSGP